MKRAVIVVSAVASALYAASAANPELNKAFALYDASSPDVDAALFYPSHPELAVKGTWSPEKMRAEQKRYLNAVDQLAGARGMVERFRRH